MLQFFKRIFENRFILINLVKRDLLNKYRRSFLGVAWTLITPLSMVGIIGAVYSILFQVPMLEFVPFLFSGLIPWLFLSTAIDAGTAAFIIAEGFITQTKTYIEIFPLRTVIASLINFFFMIIAFFIVYSILRPDAFTAYMFLIIPASMISFAFAWGVVNIVSVINLYIRDYAYIQSILIQILFYVTPIIYPVELMKEKGMVFIYSYNPFYYFVDIIRQSLLGNPEIDIENWLIATGLSIVFFIVGVIVVNKIGRKIVFRF